MHLSFIYGLLSLCYVNCFKLVPSPSPEKNTTELSKTKELEDLYYSLLDVEDLPEDQTEAVRDEVLSENIDLEKSNIEERATIFINNSKYPPWIKILCANIHSAESKRQCLNKVTLNAKEKLHYDVMTHLLDKQGAKSSLPLTYFGKPYMPSKKIQTYFKKNRLPLLAHAGNFNTRQTPIDIQISSQTKRNDVKLEYGPFDHKTINLNNINNNENPVNNYNPKVSYNHNENEESNNHPDNLYKMNSGILYNKQHENTNFKTPPTHDVMEQMKPPDTEEKSQTYMQPTTERYKINLLPESYSKKGNEVYEDYTTQLIFVENATHVNGNYMFNKLNYVNDYTDDDRNFPVAQDWKGITYYVKANKLEGLQRSGGCDIFKCIMKKPSAKFIKSKGDVVELQCICIKRKIFEKGLKHRISKKPPRYTVLVNSRKRTPEFTIQSEEVDDYVNAIMQVGNDLIRTGVTFY